MTHNQDVVSELGVLTAAVFCAVVWLGIASLFISVNWWFWLPVTGGVLYLVLSRVLEKFRG